MKLKELLKWLERRERTNYFIVAPDRLGLSLLLYQRALASIASMEDLHLIDAATVTKERARQIEAEARLGPKAGSEHTHFYIYRLQLLPTDSVGPLLKAVEEARFSRFIFQAQRLTKKTETLRSRSVTVQLPFLSKAVVLANLKAMSEDARTAEQLSLYDGTLGGTIEALRMKDTLTQIRRDLQLGPNGRVALFSKDVLNSLAFETAIEPHLTPEEKRFYQRSRSSMEEGSTTQDARKKLLLYALTARIK